MPKDRFGQLIQKGNIKLAARDRYKGSFSESLRIAQNNKKGVDLPSEKYTKLIDELCGNEDNIYWWNAEEVTQKFTQKFRDNLQTEFSNEINIFLKELSCRLSDYETLTYNMVKNEVLKNYKEKSTEYQIVSGMLRDAYDYNVLEVLVECYGTKYIGYGSKNIIVRIRECVVSNHPVIMVIQAIVGACGIVENIGDLTSNFYFNGAKILLETILPNIIVKGYEYHTTMPEIDHAIIKLDDSNESSIH